MSGAGQGEGLEGDEAAQYPAQRSCQRKSVVLWYLNAVGLARVQDSREVRALGALPETGKTMSAAVLQYNTTMLLGCWVSSWGKGVQAAPHCHWVEGTMVHWSLWCLCFGDVVLGSMGQHPELCRASG